MGNNYYQNKYSGKNTGYKKQKNNDMKSLLQLGAVGLCALGISSLDYVKSNQSAAEYQTVDAEVAESYYKGNSSNKKEFKEYFTMDIIPDVEISGTRETADKYKASTILNDLVKAGTQEEIDVVREKYADKYVEITGVVSNLYNDPADGYTASIKNDAPAGGLSSINTMYFHFNDEEDIKALYELEKGDEITVVGFNSYSATHDLMYTVYDCDIKEVNGKDITR